MPDDADAVSENVDTANIDTISLALICGFAATALLYLAWRERHKRQVKSGKD